MSKEINFTTLTIERVIIHDLPKHYKSPKEGEEVKPKLSQKESSLPPVMRGFFKEKVIETLKSSNAFRVCYDAGLDSSVSNFVDNLLSAEDAFVENSHKIAKRLFDVQNGQNSGGILVVIITRIENSLTCVIFKLDKEKGAQLTEDEESKSFDIAEVQNLMLSDKTKILKIVMLIKREDFRCEYDGLLVDYQSPIGKHKDLSSYFMNDFLGCRAFEEPRVTTRKFYALTKNFISKIEDKIRQTRYLLHLNSYIQSNNTHLNASEFSDKYLESPEEKDNYNNFLKAKNFHMESFPKNNDLLKKELEKIFIDFENGATLTATKKSLENTIKLSKLDDGRDQAVITSNIKKVS